MRWDSRGSERGRSPVGITLAVARLPKRERIERIRAMMDYALREGSEVCETDTESKGSEWESRHDLNRPGRHIVSRD